MIWELDQGVMAGSRNAHGYTREH